MFTNLTGFFTILNDFVTLYCNTSFCAKTFCFNKYAGFNLSIDTEVTLFSN